MQILSLNIVEYASISDRVIDLSPGLNIIEGENESGKSTILSFIKFILYGLPRRSSGDVVSEKERSFSWKNGVAAGSMTIRTAEGDYRIERSAREGTRGEKVVIIDLKDGTPVYKGEVPGERFLGVPLAVFESSACVKQLGCTNLDGGELGSALENLLLSADETLNTEKAVSRIDSIRRKLLHKSKQAGSIYDLTVKRNGLRTRLESAKQKAMQIMDYEASYENLGKKCAEFREKLEENRELCEAYDRKQQLIRFESLHSAKARIESIETDIAALKAEKCSFGFVPDGAYQRELALAEKDYLRAFEDHSAKKKAAERAERNLPAEKYNEEHLNKIGELGGAEAVSSDYGAAKKKATSRRIFGIISLALTVMCGVLAAFGASALLCSFALLPANLPIPFAFLEKPLLAYIFIGMTAVLAITAVICLWGSSKNRKKAKAICFEFDLSENSTEDELYSYLSGCISSKEMHDARISELERANDELRSSFLGLEGSREALFSLLRRVGKEPARNLEPAEVSALTAEVISNSAELEKALAELEKDLAKYKAVFDEREKEVSELDENSLRASLTPELLEKLGSVNITMLRREYEFLKSKTESAEQKKYFYDRELIGLRATAENPLKPEALLSETEKRLEEETELHDALSLASEAIKEAAESMRKNVTPRLRARAGEIMSVLTKGKYSDLGITPDFSITVNADGVTRPIEALSAGTRDAAYLSVRLALISVLYRIGQPPLLLDEVLSQIDDTRAAAVLSMLAEYCGNGIQCLLFSCHTRESSMTKANVVRL